MRIGVSTSLVERGRSGVGQYVVHLLAALLRHSSKHDFILFTLERDVPLFDFARHSARVVTVSESHRPPMHDVLWHQTVLPRLVRDHGVDVLHVPSHRRMLWRRPCALVATVSDLGAFRTPRNGISRGSCPPQVFRHLATRQDEIVTLTTVAAKELKELTGAADARVTSIPPGVDHHRFNPAGREIAADRIAQRYTLRPPFFLSVGRMEHPGENHGRLIAAFNAFKAATPSPWQLAFIGADASGADGIRSLALRSPYAQDIHCLGYTASEDLANWYRAAGALVYIPLRWGFGLPLLEAMACGCPVLTAAEPTAVEFCGGAAAYVPAEDMVALQRQLTHLAHDAATRARLSEAGVARARGFDWQVTAAAMADIYTRAAGRVKSSVFTGPALTTPAQ